MKMPHHARSLRALKLLLWTSASATLLTVTLLCCIRVREIIVRRQLIHHLESHTISYELKEEPHGWFSTALTHAFGNSVHPIVSVTASTVLFTNDDLYLLRH